MPTDGALSPIHRVPSGLPGPGGIGLSSLRPRRGRRIPPRVPRHLDDVEAPDRRRIDRLAGGDDERPHEPLALVVAELVRVAPDDDDRRDRGAAHRWAQPCARRPGRARGGCRGAPPQRLRPSAPASPRGPTRSSTMRGLRCWSTTCASRISRSLLLASDATQRRTAVAVDGDDEPHRRAGAGSHRACHRSRRRTRGRRSASATRSSRSPSTVTTSGDENASFSTVTADARESPPTWTPPIVDAASRDAMRLGFGRGLGFGVGLGVVVVVVDVVSVVSVVAVVVVSVVDVVVSAGRATERPDATDAVTTPAAARQHRRIASATRLTRGSVSPASRARTAYCRRCSRRPRLDFPPWRSQLGDTPSSTNRRFLILRRSSTRTAITGSGVMPASSAAASTASHGSASGSSRRACSSSPS